MGLSVPWADSFDVFALQPVKRLIAINPMGLSSILDDSIDITALDPVSKILGIKQWALMPFGPTLLRQFPEIQFKNDMG